MRERETGPFSMLDIVLGALLVIPDLRASGDCISSLANNDRHFTNDEIRDA
jgi:hypothetical protein